MPETAEVHSQHLETNRNCTIEITNVTEHHCLFNPQVHMESGHVFFPPQPTVAMGKTEVCSFDKDDNTASGAVGVLTYDLCNVPRRLTNAKMAVMFSVPFDYNIYENVLAVGIFPPGKDCVEKLYDNMYKGEDFTYFQRHEADGSGVVFKGECLEVRGSMSDGGKAIIKLEVFDKMD